MFLFSSYNTQFLLFSSSLCHYIRLEHKRQEVWDQSLFHQNHTNEATNEYEACPKALRSMQKTREKATSERKEQSTVKNPHLASFTFINLLQGFSGASFFFNLIMYIFSSSLCSMEFFFCLLLLNFGGHATLWAWLESKECGKI